MTLDRLRIFLAIVEAGSISAAASTVHLTQPAVSRNLKQLEESLGTVLFERKGRGLVLTAPGRALIPRARELVVAADELERDVRRADETGVFDLRLGAVDSVATFVLPPVLSGLRTEFDGLGIKLWTGRTTSLLERAAEDQLDAAIVAYSSPPPGGAVYRVGDYRMRYYGRRDVFPQLAECESEAALQEYPLAEIEALPGQPTMIRRGAPTFAVAASLAAVKAYVVSGFGVGALLDFMLTGEESAQLHVASRVPYDKDCGCYLVFGPSRLDESEVGQSLVRRLTVALERNKESTLSSQ